MNSEVGVTQTEKPFRAPVSGTCPAAMAPATVPRKKGVRTEEMANTAPLARWAAVRTETLRKAKPEPRSTMPRAASPSGTYSVRITAANPTGKALQATTRQKISHTWLASQTGPMERSMRPLGRRPRSAPPAVRSQNPAPKSAPPKMA